MGGDSSVPLGWYSDPNNTHPVYFKFPIFCKLLLFIVGESYLAEQFHQITHYLVEQFRQITHYLAEWFRQIAHYLAEHQIQTNYGKLKETFLRVLDVVILIILIFLVDMHQSGKNIKIWSLFPKWGGSFIYKDTKQTIMIRQSYK